MCVICDILAMRVIPIDFIGISVKEQQRITQAIEEAYNGTDRRAYVIDEYHNTKRLCPAYADNAGGQAVVHAGHCTGAFAGIEKCKHYDASKFYIKEQCRLRVRRGLA